MPCPPPSRGTRAELLAPFVILGISYRPEVILLPLHKIAEINDLPVPSTSFVAARGERGKGYGVVCITPAMREYRILGNLFADESSHFQGVYVDEPHDAWATVSYRLHVNKERLGVMS